MNTYSVDFRTESHTATEQIRAKTAHAALAKARRAASNDPDSLWLEPYSDSGPVSEIIVSDEDGREACRVARRGCAAALVREWSA